MEIQGRDLKISTSTPQINSLVCNISICFEIRALPNNCSVFTLLPTSHLALPHALWRLPAMKVSWFSSPIWWEGLQRQLSWPGKNTSLRDSTCQPWQQQQLLKWLGQFWEQPAFSINIILGLVPASQSLEQGLHWVLTSPAKLEWAGKQNYDHILFSNSLESTFACLLAARVKDYRVSCCFLSFHFFSGLGRGRRGTFKCLRKVCNMLWHHHSGIQGPIANSFKGTVPIKSSE